MSDLQDGGASSVTAHDADAGPLLEGVTRRMALGMLGAASVGAVWMIGGAAALANYVGVPSRAFSGATIPDEVPAGLMADLTDEPRTIMFGDETVYVIKKGASAVAFSGICPHAGCLVAWHADKKLFICPCHGGTFTTAGKCIAGPPPRGLDEHKVTISMGRIIVGRKKSA
jgi:cytochrome b6-f complex iron-sulfur subunit